MLLKTLKPTSTMLFMGFWSGRTKNDMFLFPLPVLGCFGSPVDKEQGTICLGLDKLRSSKKEPKGPLISKAL